MNFPERTHETMVDAIAMSSPSGRMSKRARAAAERTLCMRLFGKPEITIEDLKGPTRQPTPQERAANLRSMARLASPRQAKKLIEQAVILEGTTTA